MSKFFGESKDVPPGILRWIETVRLPQLVWAVADCPDEPRRAGDGTSPARFAYLPPPPAPPPPAPPAPEAPPAAPPPDAPPGPPIPPPALPPLEPKSGDAPVAATPVLDERMPTPPLPLGAVPAPPIDPDGVPDTDASPLAASDADSGAEPSANANVTAHILFMAGFSLIARRGNRRRCKGNAWTARPGSPPVRPHHGESFAAAKGRPTWLRIGARAVGHAGLRAPDCLASAAGWRVGISSSKDGR